MSRIVPLTQGRVMIAGFSLSPRSSTRWIVYIPESGAGFHSGDRKELADIIGARRATGYNYLVINKTGIGPRATDVSVFERSFRRKLRIRDAVAAMKMLIPPGDRITLIGYSEGAYLAPQVARLDKRVEALVMIGGGTRGWLREEISNAVSSEKAALRRQIREIESRPRSTQKWNGFSYATWNSYREDSTLEALKGLQIPTLAILGARDKTIDFKGALADLKALSLRRPVHTRVLHSCGHSFTGHWAQAYGEVRDFLENLEQGF